jgi:septal ring factor EnvC (AmiA/AmiB activator)
MRRFLALLLLAVPTVAFAQMPVPAISSTAIDSLEKRLAKLDKEIDTEKKELSEIGPRRVNAGVRARTRGRLLYKLLRAGLMPLGGGFGSFVDHAQRVERLKHAVKVDLDEEANLAARARLLTASLDTLNKEKSEVSDKKQIMEAAKVAIDEEKRRREAFERAFGTSIGPTPGLVKPEGEIVVYGPSGKMTPESIEPGSFRARKGRLTFPVSGQAEVKQTNKEGGPALEIKAALGAPVRASHAGRVAFADRYGTYGSLVILDHGDRCYTVSANLGTIDVKVGDDVSAGEKLGTVGDDGRGPSLYYEVRIGNDKVPPSAWLGL